MSEEEPQDETEPMPTEQQGEYALCPVCAEEGNTVGFDTINSLAGHFNWNHAKKGYKFKEWKDKIIYTDKKPPNLNKKGKSKKGGKMTTEDDGQIEPDMGDAARVRGKIKKLLLKMGKLTDDERENLLEVREELMEYMRALSLKEVEYDTIRSIEGLVDSELRPKIVPYTGDGGSDSKDKDSDEEFDDVSTDLMMRVTRIRSRIKADLQAIADLPSELIESVDAEKQMLLDLNRRLYKDGITKKEIQDIESRHSSVHPFIEAATKKTRKKKSSSDAWDDEDDFDEEMERERVHRMKSRLKRLQYKRDLLEEEQALKRLQDSSPNQQQALQPQPILRPKMDPETNEIMRDENGQVITEVSYQYPSATGMDPVMAMLTQITLQNLVGNNKNSSGDRIAEMMLEMKREELEHKKEMMELEMRMRENNGGNAEIAELRRMNQELQNRFYDNQIQSLQNALQSARQMAQRDQLQDLLEERDRLIQLGLAQPPGQAEQDKNVEYANRALNETVSRLDRTLETFKEGMEPVMELQTEYMRKNLERQINEEGGGQGGAGSPRPPAMSEEEQKRRWSNILHQIDDST